MTHHLSIRASIDPAADFICPRCHDVCSITEASQQTHTYQGATVTHMVCLACSEHSCCDTFTGCHTEIVDMNDISDGNREFVILQNWPLPDVLEDVPNYQKGMCVTCHTWQYWNSRYGEWQDPPTDEKERNEPTYGYRDNRICIPSESSGVLGHRDNRAGPGAARDLGSCGYRS